jgi:hypothetical protein
MVEVPRGMRLIYNRTGTLKKKKVPCRACLQLVTKLPAKQQLKKKYPTLAAGHPTIEGDLEFRHA